MLYLYLRGDFFLGSTILIVCMECRFGESVRAHCHLRKVSRVSCS